MKNKINLIIDFDSTLVKVETFNVLAKVCLENNLEKIREIEKITNYGMSGKISFEKSLKMRFELLDINKKKIEKAKKIIVDSVSDSLFENLKYFKNYENIFIISGGFKDFITPVAKKLNIPEKNIFANELIYKKDKVYLDENNLLSKNRGKANIVKKLNLTGKTIVVGDGITDLEIKDEQKADYFIAFTEHIERENVIKNADCVAKSFDEVFNFIKEIENLRFAKFLKDNRKTKVLLLENINSNAKEYLISNGFDVESLECSLKEKELIEKLKDINVLGIRSKTKITKRVIDSAKKLSIISAFCVGTDQIELEYCDKKNIKVINAPYSNTRSVAELALGEIILLMRNVPSLNSDLHKGIWNKKSNGSHEIRNQKLGIIGYGNVGSQLGILAENIGMQVCFYDIVDKLPFGNSIKLDSLENLLSVSDVISIHVDGRKTNKNLIGEKEFKQMKDGVILLNLSRGIVVNEKDLAKNIISGKVKGAGIDVYDNEPEGNGEGFEYPLRYLPNVILTPHIGGSTMEAQMAIGEYVSKKIVESYL